jgi:hypothetical protein
MARYQAPLDSIYPEGSSEGDYSNRSLKQDIRFHLGCYVRMVTVDLLVSGPAATGVQSVVIAFPYSL